MYSFGAHPASPFQPSRPSQQPPTIRTIPTIPTVQTLIHDADLWRWSMTLIRTRPWHQFCDADPDFKIPIPDAGPWRWLDSTDSDTEFNWWIIWESWQCCAVSNLPCSASVVYENATDIPTNQDPFTCKFHKFWCTCKKRHEKRQQDKDLEVCQKAAEKLEHRRSGINTSQLSRNVQRWTWYRTGYVKNHSSTVVSFFVTLQGQ